ncbi:MAG: hypothetical protein PVI39_04320 [Desulfobacteraceae bacterium]|jgi:hypothetical protein
MPNVPPPRRRLLPVLLLLTALLLPIGSSAPAGDRPPRDSRSPAVFLDISEAFYRALDARDRGERVSGTDTATMADEYLRQIAVSTRYMVETNLQLLRQQERIIQLLEGRPAPDGQ